MEEEEAEQCVFMGVDKKKPWKVGGSEPKVSISNSTESILQFGICSAIIGFAIDFAILEIA